MYVCMYKYKCMFVHMFLCMYVCRIPRMYVGVYACMWVCMHVCAGSLCMMPKARCQNMYSCTYIHTYIHTYIDMMLYSVIEVTRDMHA